MELIKLDSGQKRAIDQFLEDYYENSQSAATKIIASGLKKTQVRGLQNMVGSCTRFSEIINYIKNQTGKASDQESIWRKENAGEFLLSQLGEIEKKASEIAAGQKENLIEIKLRLARGWVSQVVAHYLYKKAQV
jgi:hypothetical protein